MVDLLVFPVGSKVVLAGDLEGMVTAIEIQDCNHLMYRVAWWNGRARIEEWVHDLEVDGCSEDPVEIGFIRRMGQ